MQTMTTECKLILRKGKVKGKGKHQNQNGTSTTNTSNADTNTCRNCGKKGHWAKACWKPSGGANDHSTNNTQKGKGQTKGKTKGEQVDTVETAQTNSSSETASTVSFSFTNTERNWIPLVHFKRGTVDHGCDSQFSVFCRKAKPIQSNAREAKITSNFVSVLELIGVLHYKTAVSDINWEVHYKTVVCQELNKITSQHGPSHE